MSDKERKPREAEAQKKPRGGMPGDGAGRVEDPGTRGHGVFPVSGPPSGNPDAQMQGMASFGQGERGTAGYQDSGQSEVFTMPPGESGSGSQPSATSAAQGIGAVGSNAGEVDPGISGSGETTGSGGAGDVARDER